MMNYAPTHEKVIVHYKCNRKNEPNIDTETFENVRLMVSGHLLIINGSPERDEENNIKEVLTRIVDLNEVVSYRTYTKYNPEMGLDNREQING